MSLEGRSTADGGGILSLDTGHFDASGHLGVAAIVCNPCPSPDPAAYQSNGSGTQYSVAVLPGNGDGTFGAPTQLSPVAAGIPLSMIVAADLGNGHTDLIISEGAAPDQILVYLGNGDGSFQSPPLATTAPGPIARIEAANLGDGHVDVAALVAASSGNEIVVFTGDGTGNLTAGTPVPLPGGTPQDLVVAPLTNGGAPSILAAVDTGNKTTSLSELLNNGSGVFPSTVTNPNDEMDDPQGIEVGRFDGPSGPPDILVAGDVCTNSFSGNCQTLLVGNGDGTFQDPSTTDATQLEQYTWRGPVDDVPIDLNGDGAPDALWLPTYSNSSTSNEMVQVALNNGTGGFSTRDVVGTVAPNVEETAVLPADLTGSGPPDLLVATIPPYGTPNATASPIELWVVPANPKSSGTFETGQGEFQVPITGSSQGWSQADESAVVGDFRHSGNQDIVTVACGVVFLGYCTSIDVNLLPGNGDGTFGALDTQAYPIAEGPGPQFGLVSGDFAGNGNLDIAYAANDAGGGGGLEFAMGKADGTFNTPVFVSAGNSTVNNVSCCKMILTSLGGVPDIVSAVQGSGGLYLESWLWNQAGTTFNPPVVSGPLPEFYQESADIAIGHFNATDPVDVVSMVGPPGGSGPPPVEIISGAADGTFNVGSPSVVATVCPGTGGDGAVAAGDLGNGHDDVLWQCGGALYVALGDGTGAFATPQTYAETGADSGGVNAHLLLANIEGNGRLDPIAYGLSGPYDGVSGINVWHNNGDGTFAASVPYSIGNQAGQAVIEAAPLISTVNDDLVALNNQTGGDLMTILLSAGGRPSLEASNVSAPTPASPVPGDPVTATYTVTNTGAFVNGSWTDSVYLDTGGTYTPGDTLLERIPQTRTLAAGGTYTGDISTYLPAIPAGSYSLIVVPDSGDLLTGGSETPAASPSFTTGPIPPLAVGSPITTHLAGPQTLYYQVTVTGAADVQIAVANAGGAGDATILAADGRVPKPGDFDKTSSPTAEPAVLTLPASEPGTWTIAVEGSPGLGVPGPLVTVSATDLSLGLTSVSPGSGGSGYYQQICYRSANGGPQIACTTIPPAPGSTFATITLNGSGFGPDLAVSLKDGLITLTPTNVTRTDSTLAFATFNLLGAPSGQYDVQVSSGGSSATLPASFQVAQSVQGSQLEVTESAPYLLRHGWVGEIDVTLTNVGQNDIAVPVIDMSSTNAVLGAPGVTDPTKFSSNLEIDNADLSADPHLDPFPDGILPAGATASLAIGIEAVTTTAHDALDTTLTVLNSTDQTAADWPTLLGGAQPSTISNASWAMIVSDFGTDIGGTNGDYAQALVGAFDTAKANGVVLVNEAEALDFLVSKEIATAAGAPVSGTVYVGDTAHPLGNVALSLSGPGGVFDATNWYDGRFNFWDVPPGSYQLAVDGYLPRPAQTVTVAPAATGLAVITAPGATLTGTVTGPGGPVSGAAVSVTDAQGVRSDSTAADGTYTITGLAAGSVSVFVTAPGLVPASGSVTVSTSAPTTDNFALVAGSAVTGSVLAPGGGPPTGAAVVAEPSAGGSPIDGTMGQDGSTFTFSLAAGTYTIVATGTDGAPASQSVTVDGTNPAGPYTLTLATPGTVSGTVTDAFSGAPIAGVTVGSDAAGAVGDTATTDSSGNYQLTNLPAGAQDLHFSPPDQTHFPAGVAINLGGSNLTQDAGLDPAGSVLATVQDSAGTPLANVALTLVGPGVSTQPTPDPNATLPQVFNSDANGNVAVSGLIPGDYDLQATGSDAHVAFTVGQGSLSPSVTLTVPTANVSGRVVDSTSTPVSGVPVWLSDANGEIGFTTTAIDGTYSFPVTATQTVDVVASDPRVGVVEDPGVAASTTTDTAVPDLVGGTAGLAVTVDNPASAAVQGATVTLTEGPSNDSEGAIGLQTDATGVATFSNLVPGSYRMDVSDGTDAPLTEAFTVQSGTHATTVTLPTGATMSGTVTDDQSADVAGAAVWAVDQTTQQTFTTTTAIDGTYTLNRLPAGDTFTLSVSAGGDAPTDVTGETPGTARDVTLPTTGSSLAVSLAPNQGGGPYPAETATLVDANGIGVATQQLGPARSSSDEAATTVFSPVTAGDYTLTLSGPGQPTTSQAVHVNASPTTASVTAPPGEVLQVAPGSTVAAAGVRAASSTPSQQSLAQLFYQSFLSGINAQSPQASPHQKTLESVAQALLAQNTSGACSPVPELRLRVILDLLNMHNALANAQDAYSQLLEFEENTLFEDAAKAAGIAGGVISAVAGLAATPAVAAAALVEMGAIAPEAVAAVTTELQVLGGVGTAITVGNIGVSLAGASSQTKLAVLSGTGAALIPVAANFTALKDTLQGVMAKLSTNLAFKGAGALGALFGTISKISTLLSSLTDFLSDVQAKIDAENQALGQYQALLLDLGRSIDALEAAPVTFPPCNPPPPPPPPPPPFPPPPNPNPPGNQPYTQPQNIKPGDPNEILGPLGDGSTSQYVLPQSTLPYTILFQNEPDATAPATTVTVTEPLPANTDPSSVELTGFGFGQTSVVIPPGHTSFSRVFTGLGLPNGDEVDVAGNVDAATSTITWTFEAINPATGAVDGRPEGGFLPPDDAAGDGEGFVSFQATALPSLATGQTVTAQGSIVFDQNPAIQTAVWTNTIDADAPASSVTALPAAATTSPFMVSWSGTDAGSGIASYDVYVSDNNGPLTLWQSATSATSALYAGTVGHAYAFLSVATDRVGNVQGFPAQSQTSTTVVSGGGGGGGGGGSGSGGSGSGAPPPPPPPAGPPVPTADVTRIQGADRIATAIAASQSQFPTARSAGAVVLARSDDFADGLAGIPLAVAKHAPLLLTKTAGLPATVEAEIQRVVPAGATIYVLGGSFAISPAVESTLVGLGFKVVRYAGTDRFDTARKIASEGLGDPSTILLATGLAFPDGLAAGPAAAAMHGAILLSHGSTLDPGTAAYLAAHPADKVDAVGGPAAAADPSATPIVGADRYATAAAVAAMFFPTATVAGLATGSAFPDALSGGAEMAALAGPLLLTGASALPAAVLSYLTDAPTIKAVKVFGGSLAVPDAVLGQV